MLYLASILIIIIKSVSLNYIHPYSDAIPGRNFRMTVSSVSVLGTNHKNISNHVGSI